MNNLIEISIITPCFNEEKSILECYRKTKKVMDEMLPNISYEHIFSDNSSTDLTIKYLKEIALKDKNVKVIVNSRNIGVFNNIFVALKYSKGNAVIPMLPADLQDPPELIPKFYDLWRDDNLVVFGKRIKRQEFIFMRLLRQFYYYLINKMAKAHIPKGAGEFMLVDRRIIDSIINTQDQYPYIRGMVAISTSKYTTIEYKWERRVSGSSKSNFHTLIDQAINGFISTSKIPARIALLLGVFFSFTGILFGIITLVLNIFFINNIVSGIPTIIVGLFIFSGLQLFFLGLIGEYVLSIHQQVKRVPESFLTEKINFDD